MPVLVFSHRGVPLAIGGALLMGVSHFSHFSFTILFLSLCGQITLKHQRVLQYTLKTFFHPKQVIHDVIALNWSKLRTAVGYDIIMLPPSYPKFVTKITTHSYFPTETQLTQKTQIIQSDIHAPFNDFVFIFCIKHLIMQSLDNSN